MPSCVIVLGLEMKLFGHYLAAFELFEIEVNIVDVNLSHVPSGKLLAALVAVEGLAAAVVRDIVVVLKKSSNAKVTRNVTMTRPEYSTTKELLNLLLGYCAIFFRVKSLCEFTIYSQRRPFQNIKKAIRRVTINFFQFRCF